MDCHSDGFHFLDIFWIQKISRFLDFRISRCRQNCRRRTNSQMHPGIQCITISQEPLLQFISLCRCKGFNQPNTSRVASAHQTFLACNGFTCHVRPWQNHAKEICVMLCHIWFVSCCVKALTYWGHPDLFLLGLWTYWDHSDFFFFQDFGPTRTIQTISVRASNLLGILSPYCGNRFRVIPCQ